MLLSLVVPCYNEEGNVTRFYSETERVFHGKLENYEIVFVDDGSRDGTLSEIEDEVKEELQVKSKYFYLDVACCNSQALVPYIEKGCSIRPRYSNGDDLYYYYKTSQILFAWD